MNKFCNGNKLFSIFLVALLVSVTSTLYSSHNAFGVTGPTVSPTPASGIYNSTKFVTLSTTVPSTIFYTTDGSTPTTSSANRPNPASLIINSNTIIKFFAKDSHANVGPTGSAQYTIIYPVITQMNDTVSSTGSSAYSGRSLQEEYVSSSSSLVGKSIDTITVKLRKSGTPTGTLQVGVFNSDLSVKHLFGTIDASTVAISYKPYSFSLPLPQAYLIQPGDRIGIKFSGGNSTNYINIMTDTTNSFDGINSYHTYYITTWNTLTGNDLYMILKSHVYYSGPTVSPTPVTGTYNSTKIMTLSTIVPSTIFYTTDGSTPTTSSANGTSPVSGIAISTNSTLKFFANDSQANVGPVGSAQYTIIYPVITQMNDTISSTGLSTYSSRLIQAEYVNNSSVLVGKSIDTITVKLRKSGTPTGTLQVGVFNSDLSVKQLFGTIDASTVATSYKPYSFSLPLPQAYLIQPGDRIGIKFSGGNSTNYINIMTDTTNSFDGTNSYYAYYITTWNTLTGNDLYMILKSHLFLDRFGIREIYPTIPGGIQWTSNFDNGVVRSFSSYDNKEGDPWLDTNHGDNSTFFIDGKGKMVAKGSPRIYVHNPDGVSEWKENLEITLYHIRINETQIVSYSGTQIFAHTNHGVGYNESTYLCPDRGYGAKPNDAGQWAFEKETAHHKSNGYADSGNTPDGSVQFLLNGSVQFFPNGMPRNTPIGVKYIIYQLPANQMKLELWADLTDGAKGGDWKKVVQVTDTGKNWGVGYDACMSGVDPAKVLTKVLTQPDSPNIPVDVSVYFRHEYAAMAYEKMSIREIDPSITN